MAEDSKDPREESEADREGDPAAKPGWVESFARRSTGLGGPKKAEPVAGDDDDARERRRLWKLAGLGLQFAGTVGIFWYMGHLLDRYMNWRYAGTITFIMLALIGSTYLLIKEAIKANR